jgi:hypothetical protein
VVVPVELELVGVLVVVGVVCGFGAVVGTDAGTTVGLVVELYWLLIPLAGLEVASRENKHETEIATAIIFVSYSIFQAH